MLSITHLAPSNSYLVIICPNSQEKQGSHRVWKTGKTGEKIMVREKSGNFILGPKSGKSQGILFQNADCHENLLLFLSIIEKVCHQYHEYESAHVNFHEIYFVLFQVFNTSTALT